MAHPGWWDPAMLVYGLLSQQLTLGLIPAAPGQSSLAGAVTPLPQLSPHEHRAGGWCAQGSKASKGALGWSGQCFLALPSHAASVSCSCASPRGYDIAISCTGHRAAVTALKAAQVTA